MNLWYKFFAIMALAYLSSLLYITAHESVHQMTFAKYGVNSSIHIEPLLASGVTIPNPDEVDRCNEYCGLTHRFTDVVGYHVAVIVITMWMIFLAQTWFKEADERGRRHRDA